MLIYLMVGKEVGRYRNPRLFYNFVSVFTSIFVLYWYVTFVIYHSTKLYIYYILEILLTLRIIIHERE